MSENNEAIYIALQESLGNWGSGKHINQHDLGVGSVGLSDC
jgi:hypothetical protein